MSERRDGPVAARPWGHRNFRYLFAARLADTAGNAVGPVALAFAVLDLTGSPADVGLVVGARSVAVVLLLLAGGVVADRLPRSTVLVWSNLVSAMAQAVVAALVLTGAATIPLLVGLSFVHGGAAAVSLPAAAALMPQAVPSPLLQRANAVMSSGINGVNMAFTAAVTVLGPAVADQSIGRARWGWVLGALSAGMLVASLALSRVTHAARLATGLVATLLAAPWILTLGLAPHTALLMVTGFAMGLGMGYFQVVWETNLQATISQDRLARIASFDQFGSFLAMPLGQVTAGPLAVAIGLSATLVGAAGLVVVATLATVAVPAVRNLAAPDLSSLPGPDP